MLSPSVLISAGLLHLLDPVVLLIAMVSVTVVLRRRGCRNRDAEPRLAVQRPTAESRQSFFVVALLVAAMPTTSNTTCRHAGHGEHAFRHDERTIRSQDCGPRRRARFWIPILTTQGDSTLWK